jgi:hypothetical protein
MVKLFAFNLQSYIGQLFCQRRNGGQFDTTDFRFWIYDFRFWGR